MIAVGIKSTIICAITVQYFVTATRMGD